VFLIAPHDEASVNTARGGEGDRPPGRWTGHLLHNKVLMLSFFLKPVWDES